MRLSSLEPPGLNVYPEGLVSISVHSGELNLLQFRTSYIDLNDIVCFLALDVVYRMGLSLKERTENDNCRQNPPDGRLCYRILQVEIIISAVAQH